MFLPSEGKERQKCEKSTTTWRLRRETSTFGLKAICGEEIYQKVTKRIFNTGGHTAHGGIKLLGFHVKDLNVINYVGVDPIFSDHFRERIRV